MAHGEAYIYADNAPATRLVFASNNNKILRFVATEYA